MNYKVNMGNKLLPKSNNIIFTIYLFFVIYMPPLLKNGNIDRAVLIISVLYVLLNANHMLSLFKTRENRRVVWLNLLLLLYSFIISLVNSLINSDSGEYFQRPMVIITFILYFFIIAGTITIYCEKNRITSEKFLKILVVVGLIQAVFVFASFFSSGIRSELLSLIAKNASDVRISDAIKASHYTALRRNYGFADTLYDRFGYTCSVLCAISFNLGLYKKKWGYYIASLIFVFSTLINARSGVVLCVTAIIVSSIMFFIHNKEFKKVIRLIGFVGMAIIVCIGVVGILRRYTPDTYEWMKIGLGSFFGYSELAVGGNSTDFYMSSETWFFPDLFGFIFGTARDPYYTLGRSTDNGYVEQIWNIGVIGLTISIILFVGSIKRALRKCSSDLEKGVLYAMMCLMLLYMVKLFAFKNIGGTYIISGYCFLLNSLYMIDTDQREREQIFILKRHKDVLIQKKE